MRTLQVQGTRISDLAGNPSNEAPLVYTNRSCRICPYRAPRRTFRLRHSCQGTSNNNTAVTDMGNRSTGASAVMPRRNDRTEANGDVSRVTCIDLSSCVLELAAMNCH